ncbi:MAG: polysaccharide deacetylase family protein [Acidimicrobiia bacterium]
MTDRQLPRRSFLAAGALAFAAACGSSHGRDALSGATSTSKPATTTAPPATTAAAATTTKPGGPARFVDRGPDTAKRVALTFHTNGDLAVAQHLLDVLAAHHTVMTSFVVGNWLDANPTWGKKLVDAGHEIANHTYTHPSFLTLSRTAMLDEVVKCRDVLTRYTGTPGTLFRPSGTDDGTVEPPAVVQSVAGEAGYPIVLGFDVDPLDYDDPGADVVVQRTLAAVHPGAIVSLHFGHAGTVAAMPAILDGLASRGLQTVTASKLLG